MSQCNVVVLGRTGDGKSCICRSIATRLGVPPHTASIFQDSPGVESHTHDPVSLVGGNPGVQVVDTPGLMDSRGVEQDERNIVKIVRHVASMGSVNGFILVVNEQAPRFDDGMQAAVKLLLDSFGPGLINNLGIVFTRAYGDVTPNDSAQRKVGYVELISKRAGIVPAPHVPSWQVDCRPDDKAKWGVPRALIDECIGQRDTVLDEILRWARSRPAVDTKDAAPGEYEERRRAREAQQKQKEAEEQRMRDNTVVKVETISRIVEYNRTSVPIFQAVQKSREEWIGGMVPKWGKMGKKTVHYTENVHVGNTVTKYMREEKQKIETLGSGRVIYGDWTKVREWQETV